MELIIIFNFSRFFLEAVSKPHLRPDGCVAGLFKMLTYY
jgi:hypothetical protein